MKPLLNTRTVASSLKPLQFPPHRLDYKVFLSGLLSPVLSFGVNINRSHLRSHAKKNLKGGEMKIRDES